MYIEVLLESPFLLNNTLTYYSKDFVRVGTRVKVPLQNREVIGFVMDIHNNAPTDFDAVSIIDVIDEEPILNHELMEIGKYMSKITISPLIRCFQTMVPNALKPSSTYKGVAKKKVLYPTGKYPQDLTTRQFQTVSKYVIPTAYSEVKKDYSGINKLVEAGYFIEKMVDDIPQMYTFTSKENSKTLNTYQQEVLDSVDLNGDGVYLLHGVTGSGKTEIYLQLANSVLKQKKSVIIMVPEISLTSQMIHQFTQRLGDQVLIYHSGLSNKEKYNQYLLAQKMEYGVVVGTRSSIFMPFASIGLIVMDEEHDASYKQSNTPYYHTLDIAKYRADYHNAPLVLGSATPSLESYARALKGNYTLLEMPHRINRSMPKIEVVDVQKLMYQGTYSMVSPNLITKITQTLQAKEQVMILLNRRGFYPLIKDTKTLEVKMCPNCDVCLTYHKQDNIITCHQCGYTERINIQDITIGYGMGTQRLEELVQSHFPTSKILRMDADTTQTKDSHHKILKAFREHQADILIGTQMIAKGLDIENVTLMAIVNADNALSYPDYRSVEVTFDTITQAIGRSGRGSKQGEVLVQTFNPDHYAVQYALRNKYKHFFQEEMKYRKMAGYPPYNYLISVIISDIDEEKANIKAQAFLKSYNKREEIILGPTRLRKLSKRYRMRILVKGKDLESMRTRIAKAYEIFYKQYKGGIIVDVNPLSIE